MDCYGRSKTALGSSTKWGATMGGGGLLSLDPKVNNATATWNHVLLPYCDGNSFSGFRDSPLVVNGEPLHMRGHSIVTYVMEQVRDDCGCGRSHHGASTVSGSVPLRVPQ